MDSSRDDRQVEIVKHDVYVLMNAFLKAKVQTEGAPTDVLQ